MEKKTIPYEYFADKGTKDFQFEYDFINHLSVRAFGRGIHTSIVGYCMRELTDKQAWRLGQFLWDVAPHKDTTDIPPQFFDYRDDVYRALDVRKIVHP